MVKRRSASIGGGKEGAFNLDDEIHDAAENQDRR